jgi:hypothetical protein
MDLRMFSRHADKRTCKVILATGKRTVAMALRRQEHGLPENKF